MKMSGSYWDLEEFLRPVFSEDGDERSPSPEELGELLLRPSEKARACGGGGDDGISFADVWGFGFMGHQRDAMEALIGEGRVRGGSQIWSESHNNRTPRHSSIAAAMDSQSSLCAGSPTSSLKPKGVENLAPGGTSGSEQSDDESLDIEAGSYEQGTNISELKRMRRTATMLQWDATKLQWVCDHIKVTAERVSLSCRLRMLSNRESARRSRKRKQAHLADLELQVDELRGENASLYKQFTDANHEFTEAATDNKVLKLDVETLRVKVKMAEDLVTRGSLTRSLDHLLQSQITTPHILNTRNLCRASEVPPIVDLQAVDLQANEGCYIGAPATGQAQNIGMAGNESKDKNIRMRLNQSSPLQSIASLDNLQSRLSSEITSCETDIWSWDSPPNIMSKQF